ncbi:MAG: hypothetical protein DRJ50_14920 [Actinobacteria bacterium]|nr:MAG: hypothetical protein DRJ50_14920 [Actinomycetota bacterium]
MIASTDPPTDQPVGLVGFTDVVERCRHAVVLGGEDVVFAGERAGAGDALGSDGLATDPER